MKEKCFEMGTIQAFLDGELTSDKLESVSRHVALCNDCALLLAEAEEESSLAFSALEQEFNTLVPTQRLWTKINDSIEKERKPFWHNVLAFFKNPTITAFAGMLIVFGAFIAYLNINSENSKNVAIVPEIKQNNIIPAAKINPLAPDAMQTATLLSPKVDSKQENLSPSVHSERNYQIVKTSVDSNNTRRVKNTDLSENNFADKVQPTPSTATYSYVSGEESYKKTIAALEKTVNIQKDEVLRPSARFAFERDIAVADDSIKKMQAEVKKNPKDEAAKDVLRTSYQNKIDLLNSVTEKNELMASLDRP